MRVFTVVGIVLTILGLGLAIVSCAPHGSSIDGEVTGMGAGIAALTLLPMGIVFTIVGVAASRVARPVSEDGVPIQLPTVQPNTLSTMGAIAPNTISGPGATPTGVDAVAVAAITDQLGRMGISVDPAMIAGGQVSMDSTTLDLRPGAQGTVLATGRPGTAIIRELTDTGVNVRGDSLVRLTLDVTPPGGTSYQVQTGSLVPDVARGRALPGALVVVRIDPTQPTNVVIDWTTNS